ncbi:MAG: hypothetical protein IJV46_06550 [Acidaminococcaceae bacterium]|nr:hypothetical protein [Acidaminococcaceae bacterium]
MLTKPIFRPSLGNRPDQLIGRDDVLEKVTDGLQSYRGSAERATLLVGQRGMGKTALLLEIGDKAAAIDYVTARVTCNESMLENLIELLQRAGEKFIKNPTSSIKGFSAGALGFSFGLTFTEEAQRSFGFRVKLEMICEKLAEAGKRVLILVDEVSPSVAQMRELASAYQELVGNEADISIVMAGLPSAISDILNYKTLTFLNRAQRIPVGLLPVSEVELYYSTAFSRAGINTTAAIVKQAAIYTKGFPYLVQLIGYYLSKLSEGGKTVDASALAQAERLAAEEIDSKVFQAMINPLSDKDLDFLKAIAQDSGASNMTVLEKRMGISHGTAQTYRKRLIDAGIIFSPRRGEVALVIPQLASYLRRMNE